MEELRGFPIQILEKAKDNETMKVTLEMDVNFYSLLYDLTFRLLTTDENMSKSKTQAEKDMHLNTLFKTHKIDGKSELKIFGDILNTLVHVIANQQAEVGFIEPISHTQNEEMWMEKIKEGNRIVAEKLNQLENESKGND